MILSVVAGIVGGTALSSGKITVTAAIAVGFILVALVLGNLFIPPFFRFVDRVEASGTLGVAGLAFAFLLAWLAANRRLSNYYRCVRCGLDSSQHTATHPN